MSQDIREFITPSCELLGLGEPTHRDDSFRMLRNDMLPRLIEHGFRSIALESDRIAAFVVDDFVRGGKGSLDEAMSAGFSHSFGDLGGNRELVSWMRDYNQGRPTEEQVSFHGFDPPLETMTVPSPRRYLEYTRDYLGLELDIADVAGDDERWHRTEALMEPTMSPGATAEAERLRSIADDLLSELHARTPELIAKTSRAEWSRARSYLTAALGLLRYHRMAAAGDLPQNDRWTRMCALRDVLMADNLFEIRELEQHRGPTLLSAHNLHLQRNLGHMTMGPMEIDWYSAGAIVAARVGDRYTFVAGSLGSSEPIGLQEPMAGTFESYLRERTIDWGLTPAADIPSADTRTDPTPEQGYFPLDQPTVDGADAILHVTRR